MIMMKVTLIKQFKNHPAGMELDVSQRIYAHLRELDCVPDPRKIEFTPEVKEAADDVEPEKSSKKKSKAIDKAPADKMVRDAEKK